MTARIILEGKKFGAWTVREYKGFNSKEQPLYLCECDCGTIRNVVAQSLRTGASKSCGCLKGAAIAKGLMTHGHSRGGRTTKTYKAWRSMHRRCLSFYPETYRNYRGRGIMVCERWSIFENFLEDMGECSQNLSLDRIDNNGNYEPGNCRWTDWSTQMSNRRKYRKK